MGLDLTEDVFSHGHLYVDVTRPEHRDNIRVLAPPERVVDGVAHVLNVVYQELIVSFFFDNSLKNLKLELIEAAEDGSGGDERELPERPSSPDYGLPDDAVHVHQQTIDIL